MRSLSADVHVLALQARYADALAASGFCSSDDVLIVQRIGNRDIDAVPALPLSALIPSVQAQAVPFPPVTWYAFWHRHLGC
jgi:hypothetical protein